MIIKTFASSRLSMYSNIRGIAYASRNVMAIRRLKSTQIRSFPSFFVANTTGLPSQSWMGTSTSCSNALVHFDLFYVLHLDVYLIRYALERLGVSHQVNLMRRIRYQAKEAASHLVERL